jgi:hypothetical protein
MQPWAEWKQSIFVNVLPAMSHMTMTFNDGRQGEVAVGRTPSGWAEGREVNQS